MLCALIGGEPGESPCPEPPVDVAILEGKIAQLEQENEALKNQVSQAEDSYLENIKMVNAENQKTIDGLKEDLQFSKNPILHKDELILSAHKKKGKPNIPAIILTVLIFLYLLLVDVPNPGYGIIRSEFFFALIDDFISAGSSIDTAVIAVLE